MYDRANHVFIRLPNLYLELMVTIAAAPWIVIAVTKPVVLFPFGFAPLVLCALYAFAPFASEKEDAFQRRVERNYRAIRLIVLPMIVIALATVAWAYPDLDLGPSYGAIMVSMFAAMAEGQHIRFRWLKHETQPGNAQG